MTALVNLLAPISKAIAPGLVIAVVLILDANGVNVPIDLDGVWEHLIAVLALPAAVYVAPANKARRGEG